MFNFLHVIFIDNHLANRKKEKKKDSENQMNENKKTEIETLYSWSLAATIYLTST